MRIAGADALPLTYRNAGMTGEEAGDPLPAVAGGNGFNHMGVLARTKWGDGLVIYLANGKVANVL